MSQEFATQLIFLILGIVAVLFLVVEIILAIVRWFRKQDTPLRHLLERFHHNPALSPSFNLDWEGQGTCNPAAVINDDDGKVHILYRAIGNDGVSRLGYASSNDGVSFSERLPYPVFTLENPRRFGKKRLEMFDPMMYPSGGSWGGCEDPRMVMIDDTIYVSFSVFGGWDFIRLAVTSIKKDDFFKKRFSWTKPLFISPEGQINKNWVLFPEKFDGKFAIMHSISPKPQIEFVEHLEDLDSGRKKIKSMFGQKVPRDSWDTWVRGVGPNPIKTEKGWLVFYHGVNKDDPHKYQVGAMLLDLHDPTFIIARAPSSVLFPEHWYENDWKPGVVYVCGAVVKGDKLFIYYGGGDKHVCVASTSLSQFLSWLITHGSAL